MAKPYQKAGKWYLRFKDESGRWKDKVTPATTLTEAKRLAAEVDQQTWRVRKGLEPAQPKASKTLGELARWWLETRSTGTSSHTRNESYLRVHILSSPIAAMSAPLVTAGVLDEFLASKERQGGLAARTVNHLRGFLHAIFEAALRADLLTGKNPAADTRRRRVPKRLPQYLKPHEVPIVLDALAARWRPLFAVAIFTGMRKGEILGLLKSDVDLAARRIIVRRSYDRDTTKSGDDGVIPIARELVPFLTEAFVSSQSPLVFPGLSGDMMREDTKLEQVLRRALARGGIVEGYRHVCRRKACGHSEQHADAELRQCPQHSMKLWPVAIHRPIRFHDLRHTTASLLIMAGADMAAVQRILRHSDPRMTMGTYAHLAPGYLLNQIDRLNFFGPTDSAEATPTPDRDAGSIKSASNRVVSLSALDALAEAWLQ
jgi:integrase